MSILNLFLPFLSMFVSFSAYLFTGSHVVFVLTIRERERGGGPKSANKIRQLFAVGYNVCLQSRGHTRLSAV